MLKKYSTCISKDTLVAEICKAIAPVFESVSEINIRTQVLDIAFAQDTRNLLDWSINPGIYILLLYLTHLVLHQCLRWAISSKPHCLNPPINELIPLVQNLHSMGNVCMGAYDK